MRAADFCIVAINWAYVVLTFTAANQKSQAGANFNSGGTLKWLKFKA